ncbi:type II CAAX prenyl endopeptidase Rce1 family protein [Bifidobacterium moraviense]|uniref:CPBP family glutamic-type intramembrane protease n=1 Tax=Bifidobacterium moraviense TaxID=2675323 RepID=UPI00145D2106|nr:CPBP family glutamic-type intramembrane protease [Bifidobacterium sp. DSM 109958]
MPILDAEIRVARRRVLTGVAVTACVAVLYWWGWRAGIVSAIRDLTGNAGPRQPGLITARGQALRILDDATLTAMACAAFLAVRRRACGFAAVRGTLHLGTTRSETSHPGTQRQVRRCSSWRDWWNAGFAYCWCMLAGFAAIDVASAVIRTPFYDYPFATRYESGWAATLYLVAMFFAGPTEELVLLGLPVLGLRHAGVPWWAVTCVAVALRVPFHLYYGWAAFAIAVWPVLAVLLFRRTGMITPLIVAHGMYDVSTAMTSLTGVAGSFWPVAVALAIMAAPVVWAASVPVPAAVRRLRTRMRVRSHRTA